MHTGTSAQRCVLEPLGKLRGKKLRLLDGAFEKVVGLAGAAEKSAGLTEKAASEELLKGGRNHLEAGVGDLD